jgi:hypothetical protein
VGPFRIQVCWQRPKGNCIRGKHGLSFMYPICPSISRKEKRATPNVQHDNSIFMHGFPYVHISAKFPQRAHRSSGELLFPFFKSALIEGDISICCVFLRLVFGHGHSSEVAFLIPRSRLLFLRRRSTGSSRISTPGPTVWAREVRYFGQTYIWERVNLWDIDSVCSTIIR